MEFNKLCEAILGSAIEVHRELGPGLLESTYERCLIHEFKLRGIGAERQRIQSINYKGLELDEGYRIDILVDNRVILELKAVDAINDIHLAQTITYLKLSGLNLAYILNFNVSLMKNGIRRVINQLSE